jgi:hypothetical protein
MPSPADARDGLSRAIVAADNVTLHGITLSQAFLAPSIQ